MLARRSGLSPPTARRSPEVSRLSKLLSVRRGHEERAGEQGWVPGRRHHAIRESSSSHPQDASEASHR